MKNQRIFLKLCEPCRKKSCTPGAKSPHTVLRIQTSSENAGPLLPWPMEEDWVDLCNECKAKIMQAVRLLISDNLQPAAVVVEMTEIPIRKELDRTCRTDLLLLIEELRGS